MIDVDNALTVIGLFMNMKIVVRAEENIMAYRYLPSLNQKDVESVRVINDWLSVMFPLV